MRVVIKTINNHKLMRDRSPDGLPRFVVESEDGTVRIFNCIYYKLEDVERILWKINHW